MSTADSREYLCSNCGRFLFRARGQLVDLEIGLNCPDRRCRFAQTKDMARPMQVTDDMRQRWARLRGQWRIRGNGEHCPA